jgi:tripartite-type tricarboxylate transporter receptor subunit TctC
VDAFIAPGKMTPEVTRKLNQAVVTVLNSPEVRNSLVEQGSEVLPTSPDEASRFINGEMERYAKMVKQIGVRPD